MNIHKNARLTLCRREDLVTRAARRAGDGAGPAVRGVDPDHAKVGGPVPRRGPDRIAGPLEPAPCKPPGHGPRHPARDQGAPPPALDVRGPSA
jgi:hypothetical protein